MKKLTPPDVNDNDLVQTLSTNSQLSSFPDLTNNLPSLIRQYSDYVQVHGNPWQIATLGFSSQLNEALIKHYSMPPKILGFIKKLRDTGSPDVCPMCGSFGTGTLDHFLPKSDYPELAIFSRNLVPACSCNTKRGSVVKGTTSSEHVLHPYFENVLNQRLMTSLFEGDFDYPTVKIEICRDVTNQRQAIEFHIEGIVKQNNIICWLETRWASLRRRPKAVISTLPKTRSITCADANQAVKEFLDDKDEEYKTPNNWLSVFLHGLINSPNAIDWLVNQHNGILNGTIIPD